MNSQPLLLLKENELSPPRSDNETMQPQSESHPENQLDLKNANGQQILKYLDKFEWKPENLKISEDVHHRVQLVLQYVTACSECLAAAKESGNPPQCSWFCNDCMKYKRVCSEHENLYTDWLCDTLQCEPCLRRSDKCVRFSVPLAYLIKPHAMRSMAGLCHLRCGTHSMISGN